MQFYLTPGFDVLLCVALLVLTGGKRMMPRDEFGAQLSFFYFAIVLACVLIIDAIFSFGLAIRDAL